MGITESKNYTVPTTWTPLTDLMAEDYETTDAYTIRINTAPLASPLGYTVRATNAPTETDKGGEYPAFSTIEVAADTGDTVYLRGVSRPVDIEITPV